MSDPILKILVPVVLVCQIVLCKGWQMELEERKVSVYMDDIIDVPYNLTDGPFKPTDIFLEFMVENSDIADLDGESQLTVNHSWSGNSLEIINGVIPLQGVFLGRTRIIITLRQEQGRSSEMMPIDVVVSRKTRAVDRAFTGSIITLVSLIYINFGCAIDWTALRPILNRPVGPIIGLLGQFLVMPIISYGFGRLIFPDRPDMQLGLLFVGVSPAGGASNVWTCVLDGNIDLSVTMTTISTLAAFGMMPLWLFTLGSGVFAEAQLAVPYAHIASMACALLVPLAIGCFIQRRLPNLSAILVRILKGFSALLILFIVIFAIATHLYLFKLFSWQIICAGLLLPWCGYFLGGVLAMIAKQPTRDVLAIAIETGVQNTGIAIFLLRFSLPQPEADLTTVVPVAVAIMTPLPLALLYLWRRIRGHAPSKAYLETSPLSQ